MTGIEQKLLDAVERWERSLQEREEEAERRENALIRQLEESSRRDAYVTKRLDASATRLGTLEAQLKSLSGTSQDSSAQRLIVFAAKEDETEAAPTTADQY